MFHFAEFQQKHNVSSGSYGAANLDKSSPLSEVFESGEIDKRGMLDQQMGEYVTQDQQMEEYVLPLSI